ncbi:4-hydroxy-tetrahydrodipicolinate reductase [bacterium]|nr:4-hydroxy-tetrahydrodipicolinate reductase [bacterium]
MIAVAVHGAEGRMGRLLTDLVDGADDAELVGLVTEPGRSAAAGDFHPRLPLMGQDRMADALPAGCVVIDFSLAPALDGLLQAGRRLGAGLVIGTTGFTAAQEEALGAYAADFPVVRAANFSIGIPTLQMLLQLLARTLPGEFDAEQVEVHHVTKLDKPSGTAAHLAGVWRAARGGAEVPTHSQRLGGVIGEHTWTFSDQEETLVVTHRAHSRRAFLRGVLPAVRFVAGARPGLYNLTDVLKGLGAAG